MPNVATSSSTKKLIKIISPEGKIYVSYFSKNTLVEEVKRRAIHYFYPIWRPGQSRFKMVRVLNGTTLHGFLTLAQVKIATQEELLLVARRVPEAATLWNSRAPQYSVIAAATASLPTPQNMLPQPNLQSLLSTNELSTELRKILISLIEAGAKLAAAGTNYENSLAQLCAALEEPGRQSSDDGIQTIGAEDIVSRQGQSAHHLQIETEVKTSVIKMFSRAEHLQKFLDKFQEWKTKKTEQANPDGVVVLKDLGFPSQATEEALRLTGNNIPAAASWLIGERGSSVFELVNGLPVDSTILDTLLKQPQIQRSLLNTRMLVAFILIVGKSAGASLWLHYSPHENWLFAQITRTYHSEKYCMAVNQFTGGQMNMSKAPSISRQRHRCV